MKGLAFLILCRTAGGDRKQMKYFVHRVPGKVGLELFVYILGEGQEIALSRPRISFWWSRGIWERPPSPHLLGWTFHSSGSSSSRCTWDWCSLLAVRELCGICSSWGCLGRFLLTALCASPSLRRGSESHRIGSCSPRICVEQRWRMAPEDDFPRDREIGERC